MIFSQDFVIVSFNAVISTLPKAKYGFKRTQKRKRMVTVSRQMIWDQCPLKLKETFAV